MGVLYYLAREDNKTLFEIGKFFLISKLFIDLVPGRDWVPQELPPAEELQALIRAAINDVELSLDHDTYAAELTRRITAFADGHWICLLNDASGSDTLFDQYADDQDELRVVDAVYTSSWETDPT